MKKFESAITIAKDASPKKLALLTFGTPLLIALLSLKFPFFRHVFTFASVILCGIMILVMSASFDDIKNKVLRDRPTKIGFKLPNWTRHVFFLIIICISAGLRLGWYIVPALWLANWVMFELAIKNIKATYKKESDNEENNNP